MIGIVRWFDYNGLTVYHKSVRGRCPLPTRLRTETCEDLLHLGRRKTFVLENIP